MLKTITVAERGELKKSQKGNAYFLVKDDEGVSYVCFHSAQHADYPGGAGVYSKITERAGKDPTIELATAGEAEKTPQPRAKVLSVEDNKNYSFALSYSKDTVVPLAVAALNNKLIKEMSQDKFLNTFVTAIEGRIIKMANKFNEELMGSHKVAEKQQEIIDEQ